MQRSRIGFRIWAATALLAALAPEFAKGDGGVILLREAQGPFSVTVFLAPEVPDGGLTDISILVQSRTTGDVVLDADVRLTLEPPRDRLARVGAESICGTAPASVRFPSAYPGQQQGTLPATRKQASNKLLYAAALTLNGTGDRRLHINVSRESDRAEFACLIPLIQASAHTRGLWPYLLVPFIAITTFALNQKLRRQTVGEEFPQSDRAAPLLSMRQRGDTKPETD